MDNEEFSIFKYEENLKSDYKQYLNEINKLTKYFIQEIKKENITNEDKKELIQIANKIENIKIAYRDIGLKIIYCYLIYLIYFITTITIIAKIYPLIKEIFYDRL